MAELEQAPPAASTSSSSAAAAAASAADVRAALVGALVEAFGDTAAGLAEASRVLAVRAYGRAFVVRAPASVDRQLRAALALVRSVRGRPSAVRLRRVCGSVRTLRHAVTSLGLPESPDAFGAQADALGAAIAAASAAAAAAAVTAATRRASAR